MPKKQKTITKTYSLNIYPWDGQSFEDEYYEIPISITRTYRQVMDRIMGRDIEIMALNVMSLISSPTQDYLQPVAAILGADSALSVQSLANELTQGCMGMLCTQDGRFLLPYSTPGLEQQTAAKVLEMTGQEFKLDYLQPDSIKAYANLLL